MSANIAAIRALLNTDGVEGPCVTEGYVPCRPRNFYGRRGQNPADYIAIGYSGVTVATGCDLGQTTLAWLKEACVPASALHKMEVYIGLKQDAAIAALANFPLRLTEDEAAAIDNGHIQQYLDRYVRPAYERDSTFTFDALPEQAQAVIFSVCYQKGCGGVRRDWPRLWGHLIAGNWSAAAIELKHGFSQYTGRRKIEGELLETIGG